jgi:hypothetical protein
MTTATAKKHETATPRSLGLEGGLFNRRIFSVTKKSRMALRPWHTTLDIWMARAEAPTKAACRTSTSRPRGCKSPPSIRKTQSKLCLDNPRSTKNSGKILGSSQLTNRWEGIRRKTTPTATSNPKILASRKRRLICCGFRDPRCAKSHSLSCRRSGRWMDVRRHHSKMSTLFLKIRRKGARLKTKKERLANWPALPLRSEKTED